MRSLFVKIDTTPNPDSLKFVPEGREVLPEKFGNGVVRERAAHGCGTMHPPVTATLTPPQPHSQHFEDEAAARGSKLARRLLKHKELTGVFFGRDFISVNKREDIGWPVRAARGGGCRKGA